MSCFYILSRSFFFILLPAEHKNSSAIINVVTMETTYQPRSCTYIQGGFQTKQKAYDNSRKTPRCLDKIDPCSRSGEHKDTKAFN